MHRPAALPTCQAPCPRTALKTRVQGRLTPRHPAKQDRATGSPFSCLWVLNSLPLSRLRRRCGGRRGFQPQYTGTPQPLGLFGKEQKEARAAPEVRSGPSVILLRHLATIGGTATREELPKPPSTPAAISFCRWSHFPIGTETGACGCGRWWLAQAHKSQAQGHETPGTHAQAHRGRPHMTKYKCGKANLFCPRWPDSWVLSVSTLFFLPSLECPDFA